ncbi:MAG: hypothetical protein ACO1OQ_02345 [Rufibacter sp.]
MNTTYSIQINRIDQRFREASLFLFGLSLCLFWFWYFIDLPVRSAPAEIAIWYYFDFLPKWVLKTCIAIFPLGFLSLILASIKKNSDGQLNIHQDFVEIKSRKRTTKIQYMDLLRISFVVSLFSFKPYRIEFIFPDKKLSRVKLKSKQDFYEVMDKIYECSPIELEKYVSPYEYEENKNNNS